MLAEVFPGVAEPMVGAPGTVRGTTVTVPDEGPGPVAFVAVTEQLYETPVTRLDTGSGDTVPLPVRVVWPAAAQLAV